MLKIYNTLTRSIEEFKPLRPSHVTMYSCGPTVYDYQQIGNMRRYVGDDILLRVLRMNGYDVHRVMNITDVGHLVSDSDTGEDKMEKGAKKFGKTVWEIAEMFTQQFKESCKLLNIELPSGDDLMKATDNIPEQIELIKKLEEKGFTYKIADGIYFDTSKLSDYFKLSRQKPDELKAGARVDIVEGKKNPSDFALWKFSPSDQKREMEWESPFGIGFPGWHIECSAMSMKALGETLDIHTGGVDHINIHHSNEIAQSEAATGKPFVKYWVHHAFLMVERQKMSKSLGNIFTVQDVVAKNFDPLALRYLYFQTHYRQEMNFTWKALDASQTALKKLRGLVQTLGNEEEEDAKLIEPFQNALNDDLNTPQALAYVWEIMKSDGSNSSKRYALKAFDEALGLNLLEVSSQQLEVDLDIPEEVQELVKQRNELRQQKSFQMADQVREEIGELGYEIEDKEGKTIIRKI